MPFKPSIPIIRRRRSVGVALGVLLVGILAGAAYLGAADVMVWWIHRHVAENLRRGAISDAQTALERAEAWEPENAETQLLRAACLRRLGQADAAADALVRAQRYGGSEHRLQTERKLGLIQSGQLYPGAELELGTLVERGAWPGDVGVAFVSGYLVREDAAKARAVLDAWATGYPGDADGAYMAGIFDRWLDEPRSAQRHFQQAVDAEPRHELARLALAQQFEKEHRLDAARQQYEQLQRLSSASVAALTGAARVARKWGQLGAARGILSGFLRADSEPTIAAEMAEIELERGRYDAARRWLRSIAFSAETETLAWPAALACSLSGRSPQALTIIDWLDFGGAATAEMYELRLRGLRAPIAQQAIPPMPAGRSAPPLPLAELLADDQLSPAQRTPQSLATVLYQEHCVSCHGDRGDGKGRAARHLFPPPRAFRFEPFRLVSTANGVATLDDIQRVIRQGMPGTSMPAYRDLPDEYVRQLAEWTLQMHREGLTEQVIGRLVAEGETADEEEVDEIVRHRITPAGVLLLPDLGPADSESIRRGRDVYVRTGCLACHGDDGRGATDLLLQDDVRRFTLPRDLVHEPLKGGADPPALYHRIVAGMPGTPHPAAPTLRPQEAVDLVRYCRSLAQEPQVQRTNYERKLRFEDAASQLVISQDHAP